MFKRMARQITPPIIWSGLRTAGNGLFPKPVQADAHPVLFDGDSALFEDAAKGIEVYFEYGVGQSTLWIDTHTDARIVSVDSSPDWVRTVTGALSGKAHRLEAVDVGPLGDWGTPRDFSARKAFPDYVEGPWRDGRDADMVLIDGRFRISCFFNSLLKGRPGTKIIFDDYGNRPTYHVVEEFLVPLERSARQALFVIPQTVPQEALRAARDAFILVRE